MNFVCEKRTIVYCIETGDRVECGQFWGVGWFVFREDKNSFAF